MTRRLLLLLASYVAAALVAAMVFDLAEGRDLASSLWRAIVTATTVGYGDLSPTSAIGRVVAVLLMHLTTLMVMPRLTAEIAAKLIIDSDAFTHDEQEAISRRLRGSSGGSTRSTVAETTNAAPKGGVVGCGSWI